MSDGSWWRPGTIRAGFAADLAVVAVLVVGTVAAVTVPGVRETPVRVPLGFVLVLFLPGYALVAAGFPERRASNDELDRPASGGSVPPSAWCSRSR